MRHKIIGVFIVATLFSSNIGFAQATDTVTLQKQLVVLLQKLVELYRQLDEVLRAERSQYANAILAPQPAKTIGLSIKVRYPNGGEVLIAGSQEKIGWSVSDDLDEASFEIDLVDANGALVAIIAEEVDGRSYWWDVPIELGYTGKQYKILVSSLPSGKKGAQDFSNSSFTIIPPSE